MRLTKECLTIHWIPECSDQFCMTTFTLKECFPQVFVSAVIFVCRYFVLAGIFFAGIFFGSDFFRRTLFLAGIFSQVIFCRYFVGRDIFCMDSACQSLEGPNHPCTLSAAGTSWTIIWTWMGNQLPIHDPILFSLRLNTLYFLPKKSLYFLSFI